MNSWFRQLDELLRGRRTRPDQLADGKIDLPIRLFLPLAILLGAAYGFFMGWYGVLTREDPEYIQVVASMVKLPALFILTLIVTFPSLYVFNALVGCRLGFKATLRLLVAAIVVNVTVAASLGPILGFFTYSTTSYPFMIILNVALLGISGMVGLGFLLHTLRKIADPFPPARPHTIEGVQADGETENTPPPQPGILDSRTNTSQDQALGQAWVIFKVWVIIYALVGAQTGWLLRPFIGCPDLPFTWLRNREGNFFQSVLQQVQNLLGG